jgi:cation:H+ antiporter
LPVARDIGLFAVSLVVTLAAAAFFARRLDRVGLRLGLPETLLGLLTALAADAPELASAVAALVKGAHGVGVGVVVGSNVFNLAAMVGVTAVVCGTVRVRRETLVLEGAVALAVTLAVSARAVAWIGSSVAIVLVAAVVVPYLAFLALGPRGAQRLPVDRRLGRALRRTFGEEHRAARPDVQPAERLLAPALLLVPAVAIIVAGSAGMVEAAVDLGHRWDIPGVIVGVLVLAVTTSLPNAFTAIRLGRQGRGSALVSETFNSNTINLVGGIAIPALFLTLDRASHLVDFDVAWMIGMTVATWALLGRRAGTARADGAVIVALYAVFVTVQLARAF